MGMCLDNRWTHLEFGGVGTNKFADFVPILIDGKRGHLTSSQHFDLPEKEGQLRTARMPTSCEIASC
jgi:hypothetical protein